MIGESMRAALREVERLSMLCREQKNEISSLRRRLAERSAVQDLEAAAEALSPDRRMGEVLSSSSSSSSAAVLTEAFLSHQITMEDDTDAMSRTARSVNESLRGLTREDLSETTTTTMTEFDDAAEAVMARLWALASFYFREADRNNNGLLTHTEIRLFLRQHLDEKRKFGVHEFGWRGLWAAMDKNKDGQTDEHEWCQFFVKAVSPFSYAWPGESAQKSARKVGSREGGNKASSSSSSRKKRNNRGSRLKDRKGGKARGIKNKKVRMKLSPKVSPYAAQPPQSMKPADPYDILHTPPKDKSGPRSSGVSHDAAAGAAGMAASAAMLIGQGSASRGTPPLAQTHSPVVGRDGGGVLSRSGGSGMPDWSPLHSSEERWLDLGMSPHRPKAHGYVPRHGKVAPLENDHSAAFSIHEPRSTIRRSPSAAIYHEPSVVRHVTQGVGGVGGDDSDNEEEEEEEERGEEEEEGGEILDESFDLGARVSAAEMLVRLRGVAGSADEEDDAAQELEGGDDRLEEDSKEASTEDEKDGEDEED